MPGHKHFCIACADPFSSDAVGAKLPFGPNPDSYSASAYLRLDGALNTAGRAYIYYSPSPYNDQICLWYSTSTDDNTVGAVPCYFGVNHINEFDMGGRSSASQLPYSSQDGVVGIYTAPPAGTTAAAVNAAMQSDVTVNIPGVRARLVASGIRLTYTGSTLNDGGLMYAILDPNNENLDFTDIPNFAAQMTCTKIQKLEARGVVELSSFPVQPESFDFSPMLDRIAGTWNNGLGGWSMGKNQPVPSGTTWYGWMSGYYLFPVVSPSTTCGELNFVNASGMASSVPNNIMGITSWDYIRNAKKWMRHFFPFCREDVVCNIVDISQNGLVPGGVVFGSPFTTDVNGIITSTITWNGCDTVGAFYFNYNTTGSYMLQKRVNVSSGAYYWVCMNTAGVAQASLSITLSGTSLYCVACPNPITGAIVIDGGTANAGQTYHLEYVVHAEYTGVNTQGRTECNPADPHGHAVLAALQHARHFNGMHEHGNLGDFLRHSAAEACAHHGQQVVNSVVNAVVPSALRPGVRGALDGLLARGVKRLRR